MLEFVVGKLIALLGPIATMEKEKRDLKNAALSATSKALRETKLYYRDQSQGSVRDQKRENDLCRLWADAAVPLSHIDQELALLCERKSEYWIRPDSYTDAELQQLGIKLDSVSLAYSRMLSPEQQRKLAPKNSFKPKPLRGAT